MGPEAPGRQVRLFVKLAGVGHPLIDQYQAGTIIVQQFPQDIPGIGGPLVIGPYSLIGFAGFAGSARRIPQLPSQFPP